MAYFIFLPTDLLSKAIDFLQQYSKIKLLSVKCHSQISKLSCRVFGNALKYSTVCMQIYARDFTGLASSKLMYIQNAVVEDFFPPI